MLFHHVDMKFSLMHLRTPCSWSYNFLDATSYDKYKAHIGDVLLVAGRCLRLRPEYMRLLKHILASVGFIS